MLENFTNGFRRASIIDWMLNWGWAPILFAAAAINAYLDVAAYFGR